MKKLWQNTKFKIGGSITILAGAVALFFSLQKQPGGKVSGEGGIIIVGDTVIHRAIDTTGKDSVKLK
jgi:hypothetical protein